MTLNTKIFIDAPVDHRVVMDKACELLDIRHPLQIDEVDGDERSIDNRIGQGFNAWVMSSSRVDGGRLPAREWQVEHGIVDRGYVALSVDTAYGEGTTLLHAQLVVDLVRWLHDEHDATLRWVNEYTGEVNVGAGGMESFLGSGDEAQRWFADQVMPLIGELACPVVDPVSAEPQGGES